MISQAKATLSFTPLESPSIYAGDGENRKHQLLIEGGVKALPFLTGFTKMLQNSPPCGRECMQREIKKTPLRNDYFFKPFTIAKVSLATSAPGNPGFSSRAFLNSAFAFSLSPFL